MFREIINKFSVPCKITVKAVIITIAIVLALSCSAIYFVLNHISPTIDIEKPPDDWIRVLVAEKIEKCSVNFDTKFKISYKNNGTVTEKTFTDGKFNIEFLDGFFCLGDLYISASELTFIPLEQPFVVEFNKNAYRGNIRLIVNGNPNSFDVVNNVPLESYLNSVVSCEIPAYWKSAALEAQAVASRTYVLYYKKVYGGNRNYDIHSTEGSQVYRGVSSEHWLAKKAVEKTAGLVMFSNGQLFPAYYSSICGGNTENSFEVFGKSFDALVETKCPYCIKTASDSKFFWGPYRMEPAKLTEKLCQRYDSIKALGEIKEITARKKSQYQGCFRWTNIILTGENGKTITLRAEDFRLALDTTGRKIRSTIFELANINNSWIFFGGRGFGHGVGLCQYGANAMAKNNSNFEEILKFYYKNVEIRQMEK